LPNIIQFRLYLTKLLQKQNSSTFLWFTVYIYVFFFYAPTGQTPKWIFTRDSSNDAASCKVQAFQS